MTFERRILHHGESPEGAAQLLSTRAIRSCWFDLHRQGGCGAGEIVLSDEFPQRDLIEIGDWISCEAVAGDRWYLGRVEERSAESPARVRLRLEGMSIELNETFPGGFGVSADGRAPRRIAATDQFPYDPDYSAQAAQVAATADDALRALTSELAATRIHVRPERIETPARSTPFATMVLRGEESLHAVLKDLAVRSQAASWGVDAAGEFFFLRRRTATIATFREGADIVELLETRDRELLFNRLLLTGDYVYDRRDASEDVARRSYRWRGHYLQPTSRAQYGDRRLRLWLPWMRTEADARAFAREFFRLYARPVSRFFVETTGVAALPLPWLGRVRIEDRAGHELVTGAAETVRVLFDHVPRLRMIIGPVDPRELWPEPPQDERWELPNGPPIGGDVTLTSFTSDGDGGSSQPRTSVSATDSADTSSSPSSSGSDGSCGGSLDRSSAGDSTGSSSAGGSTHDDSVSVSSGDDGSEDASTRNSSFADTSAWSESGDESRSSGATGTSDSDSESDSSRADSCDDSWSDSASSSENESESHPNSDSGDVPDSDDATSESLDLTASQATSDSWGSHSSSHWWSGADSSSSEGATTSSAASSSIDDESSEPASSSHASGSDDSRSSELTFVWSGWSF